MHAFATIRVVIGRVGMALVALGSCMCAETLHNSGLVHVSMRTIGCTIQWRVLNHRSRIV